MTELLVIICGVAFGILGGLLPGIGISLIVASAYPVLSLLDIKSLFAFYISLIVTMQYYGSITAILYGVLGETTSAPAAINGHELLRRGEGNYILAATATSSFIASLFGLLILVSVWQFSDSLIFLLSAKVKVACLFTSLVILAAIGKQVWTSVGAIFIGLLIGVAGTEIIPWSNLVFPKYSVFDGGIPFIPILVGIIVIPTLTEYIILGSAKASNASGDVENVTIEERIRHLFSAKHISAILRGTFVGSLAALVPGAGYTMSSSIAESLEKILNSNSKTSDSLMKNVLSAEAANNAASTVVLIPLMLFAIPLVPSEAMILSLAESHGFNVATGATMLSQYLGHLIGLILAINVVNWILSGYLYKYIAGLYRITKGYVYYVTLVVTVSIVVYFGMLENQMLLTLLTLFFSSVVGFTFKDTNVQLAFVFSFLMSSSLMPELYRFWIIYGNQL